MICSIDILNMAGRQRYNIDRIKPLAWLAGKEVIMKQSSKEIAFGTAALYCRLSRDDDL